MANDEGATPLREEKVTMRGGVTSYGGSLTLKQAQLIWKGSGWFYLQRGLRLSPKKVIAFDLRAAQFWPGPRWPGLSILLFPITAPLELLTGGFRQTLQVDALDDTYWFAVKDVNLWLGDIAKVGGNAHV